MKSFLSASVYLSVFIWIGPLNGAPRATSRSVAPSPWIEILKVLNQDPGPGGLSGLELETDLLAKNKDELKAIGEAWKSSEASLKGAEARRVENEFFHTKVLELNEKSLERLGTKTERERGVDKARVKLGESILEKIKANPVANLEATQAYDPSGQLGFCFGRALLVHYYLLENGVKPSEIAKIFVAGQLRVGHRMWNFHVATVVGTAKTGYLVVDPLHAKPMELSEWLKISAAYEIKGSLTRARFYVTDPRKFLPSFGAYSEELVGQEHLKDYFRDLAGSIAEVKRP